MSATVQIFDSQTSPVALPQACQTLGKLAEKLKNQRLMLQQTHHKIIQETLRLQAQETLFQLDCHIASCPICHVPST